MATHILLKNELIISTAIHNGRERGKKNYKCYGGKDGPHKKNIPVGFGSYSSPLDLLAGSSSPSASSLC
jgi:hypothetical protein